LFVLANDCVISEISKSFQRPLMVGGMMQRYEISRTTVGWVVLDRATGESLSRTDSATRASVQALTDLLNLLDQGPFQPVCA